MQNLRVPSPKILFASLGIVVTPLLVCVSVSKLYDAIMNFFRFRIGGASLDMNTNACLLDAIDALTAYCRPSAEPGASYVQREAVQVRLSQGPVG